MNFLRASQENEAEESKEVPTKPPASVAAAWTSDHGFQYRRVNVRSDTAFYRELMGWNQCSIGFNR